MLHYVFARPSDSNGGVYLISTAPTTLAADPSPLPAFYNTLSEKERRRFAAVEAERLGYGGISYVADVLGCNERTVRRGIEELDSLQEGDPLGDRQRRSGAGRPKKKSAVRD